MAETLFIDLDGETTWCLCGAGGATVRAGGAEDLSGAAEAFEGEVVVTVPTRDVLRTTARVPSRQYRQILQAVPYAVEEQLAMDVDDCFFALGGRTPSGAVEVLVTARENMESWTARLRELGVAAATMLPASELVPRTAGVDALVDGPRATLRWGEGSALETDTVNLAAAIALIARQDKPHINIHMPEDAPEDQQASVDLQVSELGAGEETPPEVRKFSGDAGNWLRGNYLTGNLSPVNLLQGEYKVEADKPGKSVWRSVAALAACAVGLHLASLVGQGVYLSRQASAYEETYRALYRETFPADKNVRDYRWRWDSHLGKSSGEGGQFLALFARSSRGLEGAGLTLDNVNYNESRGDLVLQVTAGKSEALVAYAQALASQGLDAEIGTISQDGSGVRGSIRVKAGGAS